MKQASQTYLLLLTSQEFEQITLAIMLQSNKAHKLQGFGQCIARWLRQWNSGEFRMTAQKAPHDVDASDNYTHQIYVGLAGETIQLFKAWRAALVEVSANPIPVRTALMVLVACSIAEHRPETA